MSIAYGNNGRWEGNYWVMDTDRDAPSGDPSEACGTNAYYKIHKNKINSRSQIGFCTTLPGWPAKWKVSYSSNLIIFYDPDKKYDPESAFRLSKTDFFEWGDNEDIEMNQW